ncbi:FAD-dependent oxidoreductase [Actinokineospora fastidiosa]|nr:FAD-dependent oxidoreductase [Actinokineospora fastidiosa]
MPKLTEVSAMRALICGAGIAGLTLAWWLRRADWEVTVVERAPGPRPDGYMMDFFGSGYDIAERMGLIDRIVAADAGITALRYTTADGEPRGGVSYASMRAALDGRLVSLMRGDLDRVLREAVPDLDIRYGTSLADADTLTDGSPVDADLVVGADGIHSRVRELTFGPERAFLRPLGYHTASYLLTDPDLADAVGDRFRIVAQPNRQAGLYPAGGHLATMFVHATDAPLTDNPRALLKARFAGMGELVDRALDHCPDDPYYDTVAQIELPSWHRGRTVLIGDAAHAVSLMAGQGASLAMAAAWVLAGELAKADVPRALPAYEARMRPFAEAKQRSGRRAARWMLPESRWKISLRNRLLGVADLPGGPTVVRKAMAGTASSIVG